MPELPEVETIARWLRDGKPEQSTLLGRTISAGRVLWERSLAEPDPLQFAARLRGQRVEHIGRRGKFLQLALTHDTLLVHLRMSGDLWLELQTAPDAKHHRVVIDFDDGQRLAFNDARKFGRVWLTPDPAHVLNGLGPEPLGTDLTPELFFEMLQRRSRQLKPLLLDQSFIAGLGNIYTDEALHLARLHPLRLARTLSFIDAANLLESIRVVLQEGIRRQGASIDWVYRGGDFQNYFHVYQRDGEACPRCGTLIRRIVIGQRGTHYCPVCQPEEIVS